MFSKILIANRGEIAVRAIRAARELGCRSVAVFPEEDRNAVHRTAADEAYRIGAPGHPVRAYLDVEALVSTALACGAQAVYPGYGFLSENPDFAEACEKAGLVFVGPPSAVLELAGDKVRALTAARAAGLPVLRSTPASRDPDLLLGQANEVGFPLFVKAVAGGGGRGMRRVQRAQELPGALAEAMHEAQGAFGDPTVFLEQALSRPRHIEVQVLADGDGDVVHLFERDCSVQRRHQKVVEIAPAHHLDAALRDRLHGYALDFARAVHYVNAGTVEFLVDTVGDRAGRPVFIEMNPRVQVEHTVTEEITDVDLVVAQLQIAAGATLGELGLVQERITVRGAAVQCRVTTEDPADGFRPGSGVVSAYQSPGGAGIRLDGGTVHTGAEVSPYFDSTLVKLVAHGADFPVAVRRARRALAEFSVRGVSTNLAFLRAVLAEPDFATGVPSTAFIEEHPAVLAGYADGDQLTRVVTWLADVTVNRPYGPPLGLGRPAAKLPQLPQLPRTPSADPGGPGRGTWYGVLREHGPAEFARRLRAHVPLAVADTTFRDAHQSLLATRMRTRDLVEAGAHEQALLPDLLAVECWGGATYDVALRFLGEDPWERLDALRSALPGHCLQMLLRGGNTVGYGPCPPAVTEAFVREAAVAGMDVFRVFDALNDVSRMRPALDAVLATGTAVAEAAICYTGNLLSPGETVYTLDYYLRVAEAAVAAGAHVLAIKDMAGLLRPVAARRLVTALRERFDLPVRLHGHDTSGAQLATLVAAAEAGVDAVDVAAAPLAGGTSQPSMSALVAACQGTGRDTELDLDAVTSMEPYWAAVRRLYAPFEARTQAPSGRVYAHEIPGGQITNLHQQAASLGLGDRFEEVEAMYAAADRLLGRPVKVTPTSKVVGDLALHLVAHGVAPEQVAEDPVHYDLPESVLDYLAGELGEPACGWVEPMRSRALAGRRGEAVATGTTLSPADAAALAERPRETLNRLIFPGPAADHARSRARFGNLSVLDTADFLYGLEPGREHEVRFAEGVTAIVSLTAVAEADALGVRTVLCTVDGQLRALQVRDRSVEPATRPRDKADVTDPGQLAAPFPGAVTVRVRPGDEVHAGQMVAGLEAMKMEASITSPIAGTVARIVGEGVLQVDAGDLVVVVTPAGGSTT